ncbi:MAG: hypothetical protein INF78_18305 [Roseomonas sp.]|nr:hypothetical protein [Roseomonas sp.]MCA3395370.1 hypothetical protein [Roseomonas sp.]MCA3399763.1 hypothetical protein [Roseomonas sp.]
MSYADLMSSNQAVTVDLVIQRAFGAGGNDTLVSVEGALTGAGNDSVLGDALANMLASGSGNDTIVASGGNDIVNGGFGEDSINGGAGVDSLSYAGLWSPSQAVTVDLVALRATGAAGNDTPLSIENVVTGAGNDTIMANGGDDTINGGFGEDRIDGGAGLDVLGYADLTAPGQAVTVDLVALRTMGVAGNDTLIGIENILTGAGNDSLVGDSLANMLLSGAGNDTISGGEGNDTLDGGSGVDLLSYASLSVPGQAVTVDLALLRTNGAAGNDVLAGIENVLTGAGDDSLLGDGFGNELSSGNGDDTIQGAGGDDTIVAGFGRHSIDGGVGLDWLSYADLVLSNQAVTIDLAAMRASGTSGNDTLAGLENVLTGAGNDSLLGDLLCGLW